MKKFLALSLAALALGTLVFVALIRPEGFQWDLLVFYRAGLAWRHGLNPYDFEQLITAGLIPRPAEILSFTYIPAVAALFSPLSLVSFPVAAALWITIKGLFFILLWKSAARLHRFDSSALLDVSILVLGFNSALFSDLLSGNTSIVLWALLWWAIRLICDGKFWTSALLIGYVATVKLQPVLLLALLLAVPPKPKWGPAAGGLLIFGFVIFLNAWIWPEMFQSFFQEARHRAALERGVLAPSLYALCADAVDQWKNISVVPEVWKQAGTWLPVALYVVFALPIAAITSLRLLRTQGTKPALAVALILLTWILVVPRLKSYDFILILPVATWVLRNAQGTTKYLLAVLVLLPVVIPIVQGPLEIFSVAQLGVVKKVFFLGYQYLPWFAAFGLWAHLVAPQRDFKGLAT